MSIYVSRQAVAVAFVRLCFLCHLVEQDVLPVSSLLSLIEPIRQPHCPEKHRMEVLHRLCGRSRWPLRLCLVKLRRNEVRLPSRKQFSPLTLADKVHDFLFDRGYTIEEVSHLFDGKAAAEELEVAAASIDAASSSLKDDNEEKAQGEIAYIEDRK